MAVRWLKTPGTERTLQLRFHNIIRRPTRDKIRIKAGRGPDRKTIRVHNK